jgi:hypothetical protein
LSSSPVAPACALAATLHDPAGRLLQALEDRAWALAWYGASYVCATDVTDGRVIAALCARAVTVLPQPVGRPGQGRRDALAAAVRDGHDACLYCDLDRWLHWVGRFPDELHALPTRLAKRRPSPWYVCLGRSRRAFATHPDVQRLSERATNLAFAAVTGRRVDATAGACWLAGPGASLILTHSREPTQATDLEWPALVYRADPRRLISATVEGLEFETAEFFAAEIAAAGSETAWLRATYQSAAAWHDRLRLAADSVAALRRVLGDQSRGGALAR